MNEWMKDEMMELGEKLSLSKRTIPEDENVF